MVMLSNYLFTYLELTVHYRPRYKQQLTGDVVQTDLPSKSNQLIISVIP